MSLSCATDFDGGDDCAWYWLAPKDYAPLSTKRRRKCCSCKTVIKVGETAMEFPRFRHPCSEIEERIYGEGSEIDMAAWFMCETCGDLYLSLDELGFCCDIGESLAEQIKEYRAEETNLRRAA